MLRIHRSRSATLRKTRRFISTWWYRGPLARDVLLLVLGWLALSAIVDLRYPAPAPQLWYLAPSLDVTVILVSFAAIGALGFRVPRPLLVVLALLFTFIRLFRVTDGVTLRMQHRTANAFIDVRMFPGLVRLATTTIPPLKLALMTLAGVFVLLAVGWASYLMLRMSARLLTERRRRLVFGTVVALVAATPLFISRRQPSSLYKYKGAFTASVVPRFADDFTTYWASLSFPDQVRAQVAAREKLTNSSGLLSELHGTNVLLIWIESYGETVLHLDEYRAPVNRAYKRWEATLEPQGFHIASTILESPTVGGYSWLAHTTFDTGIKVTNQAEFQKVEEMHPKTLVHSFVQAGYDTLLVQPATMRNPGPLIYPFKKHNYSWEFGYRGRNFSWAPMPDQFTLDFVYRNEIRGHEGPLYVEYNLASGHMPWNDQANIVPDWNSLGDGSIFRNMQGVRFNTDWSNLSHAQPAYLNSMLYCLEVLRQYIERFVQDDTLIIMLGDHQPVGDVTGHSKSRGVPIHVVSRNPVFVDKFVARGYANGMRPQNSPPYPGMEGFMEQFLADFSRQ